MVDSVNSDNAYYLANGCVEEGLMRTRRDLNYKNENKTITIDTENSCTIEINESLGTYTLIATGNSYDQTQRIQVIFTITSET